MNDYSLSELADRAGVTPRTIRYYIQNGLLPSPGASGPGRHYDDRYLRRIRLIKRLQRRHLPLSEIRARLDALDEEEIRDLASGSPERIRESADHYIAALLAEDRSAEVDDTAGRWGGTGGGTGPAAGDAVKRSRWERISLGPDIEIHVQRPLSRRKNRVVDEIVSHARELLEEEEP